MKMVKDYSKIFIHRDCTYRKFENAEMHIICEILYNYNRFLDFFLSNNFLNCRNKIKIRIIMYKSTQYLYNN